MAALAPGPGTARVKWPASCSPSALGNATGITSGSASSRLLPPRGSGAAAIAVARSRSAVRPPPAGERRTAVQGRGGAAACRSHAGCTATARGISHSLSTLGRLVGALGTCQRFAGGDRMGVRSVGFYQPISYGMHVWNIWLKSQPCSFDANGAQTSQSEGLTAHHAWPRASWPSD
jgi:hypothetical protein